MENTPDTATLADQIVSLSDALARHRLEFQAAESALVTRIADVDDDRRLTTNRLQRAWQTHHEEIDARLKHQGSIFVGALLLVAVALGGALFFAYGQLDVARRALIEDVARLRVDYEKLAAVAAQDAALQEGLDDLRASVAALSESLPPRVEEPEPQAPTEESASTDQAQKGLAAESTEGDLASSAEAIPSTPAEDESVPIAQAVPEADASPSSTAIRDKTDPALPKTPEDLAGQDPEPAPEPSLEAAPEPNPASDLTPSASSTSAPSPPVEATPPQSIEPAVRSLETDTEPTRSVTVRIVDAPLIVGNTPFALQLIGFYSLDELLDFTRREELPPQVYFREESYQGRPWFVLIHSLYAGYSDASAAIDRLPTQLATLDTWIRSFSPETRLGILHIER